MTFDAFDISPVPPPGPDAVAPEPFHGLYGMPVFITLPCPDLAASTRFWVETMGFFELFTIPGRLVHLRRWAFQDVLLVPADDTAEPSAPSRALTSFACVLAEVEPIAQAVRAAGALVSGPTDTPWNTRDVEVATPEGARVVFTAARPWDPSSQQARNLAAVGIHPTGDAPAESHGR